LNDMMQPNEQREDQASRQVLLFDDDQLLRELLVGPLEDEGYGVRAARNGREALAVLDIWRPDLILLDLMMPVMDGWTFRRRQLELEQHATIPVMVLSAGPNLGRGVEALRATVIMPKPFDLDVLLDIVRNVARLPR